MCENIFRMINLMFFSFSRTFQAINAFLAQRHKFSSHYIFFTDVFTLFKHLDCILNLILPTDVDTIYSGKESFIFEVKWWFRTKNTSKNATKYGQTGVHMLLFKVQTLAHSHNFLSLFFVMLSFDKRNGHLKSHFVSNH